MNKFLNEYISKNPDFKAKFLITSRIHSEVDMIKDNYEKGYIVSFPTLLKLKFYKIKPTTVVVNKFNLSMNLVNYCNKHKLRLLVYTVNNRNEFNRLKSIGISGLYTDFFKRLN